MAVRRVELFSELVHLIQKFRPQEFLRSRSIFCLNSLPVSLQDGFQDFVTSFEDDFQQLLGELILVATGEAAGVVVDWRAGVVD